MVHRETMAEARASSAIGAIAAGAAHEMNNPLAIIMGRSHLLGRCLSSTELSGAAGEIQEAASRLAGLVSSLAESVAPIEIKREPTDVAALLSEASGPSISMVQVASPFVVPVGFPSSGSMLGMFAGSFASFSTMPSGPVSGSRSPLMHASWTAP